MKCFSADHACAEKHEEQVRNKRKHKEGPATAQKSSIKCCSNPGIISKALPHHGHVGLVWLVVVMHCLPSICCFAYARRSSQLFVLYLVALTMGNLFEKLSLWGAQHLLYPLEPPASSAVLQWTPRKKSPSSQIPRGMMHPLPKFAKVLRFCGITQFFSHCIQPFLHFFQKGSLKRLRTCARTGGFWSIKFLSVNVGPQIPNMPIKKHTLSWSSPT